MRRDLGSPAQRYVAETSVAATSLRTDRGWRIDVRAEPRLGADKQTESDIPPDAAAVLDVFLAILLPHEALLAQHLPVKQHGGDGQGDEGRQLGNTKN